MSQNVAFSQIKEELSKLTTLLPYNMEAEAKVAADSSSYGVGAVLLQKHQQSWRLVAYASRSLSETEKRCAQVEKERHWPSPGYCHVKDLVLLILGISHNS